MEISSVITALNNKYDNDKGIHLENTKADIDDTTTQLNLKANSADVLLKVPQTLTLEEANQVRLNIHSVGQYATGLTYTPYEVVEEGLNTSNHTVTEVPLDPVVAATGAELYNDYSGNISTGLYAIATGYKTQATGNYSRSNGWWTRATGQCSNAEGLLSVASGNFAHAEGTRTKATKNNTHSEGDLTEATGNSAHSEGVESKATGNVSHAEGWKTKASGVASHSAGEGTIAAGRGQCAVGKYNVSDTSSMFIVGKGSSDTSRSNAFKVTNTGEGYFASDVYVGNASGTSNTKKLATEAYVDEAIANIPVNDNEYDYIILKSSTEGSTKKFKLTIDDSGILTTSEIE